MRTYRVSFLENNSYVSELNNPYSAAATPGVAIVAAPHGSTATRQSPYTQCVVVEPAGARACGREIGKLQTEAELHVAFYF
jgi:hypothetical protein